MYLYGHENYFRLDLELGHYPMPFSARVVARIRAINLVLGG